jgi:hypothetical protein
MIVDTLPAKKTKGWLNSHYTLETNIEEDIFPQPIHRTNIERTIDDAVTFNSASSPVTDRVTEI